jgi:hypothetical protein
MKIELFEIAKELFKCGLIVGQAACKTGIEVAKLSLPYGLKFPKAVDDLTKPSIEKSQIPETRNEEATKPGDEVKTTKKRKRISSKSRKAIEATSHNTDNDGKLAKTFRFPLETVEILENWYKLNESNPFARREVLRELSAKTKLNVRQITKWLHKKRLGYKTIEARQMLILEEFFKNDQYPILRDIIILQKKTGLEEKQIRSFFARKRFLFKRGKSYKRPIELPNKQPSTD